MSSEPTRVWASDEAAERWRRTAQQRQQTLSAVTAMMLDAAGLESGRRVLDLAAGTGDTSILAARRVGPEGSVLAVDISAAMLREATDAFAREGLTNIETLVCDIVEVDLPPRQFNAAISRFGLMFLTDVVEGMRRIRAALTPSSRLSAVVWSTAERNPFITAALALSGQLGFPIPDGSPFRRVVSLGGPGVFETALRDAGFADVSVRAVPIPREFDSVDAALQSMESTSSVLRELLAQLDPSGQESAREQLRRRLSEFVRGDGRCAVPGEALLGVASAF
jgi:SAM-dependent methyltransferase